MRENVRVEATGYLTSIIQAIIGDLPALGSYLDSSMAIKCHLGLKPPVPGTCVVESTQLLYHLGIAFLSSIVTKNLSLAVHSWYKPEFGRSLSERGLAVL